MKVGCKVPPEAATSIDRLRWVVTLVALSLMLLATLLLTTITYRGLDEQLDHRIALKGRLLTDHLVTQFERAAQHGIPLSRLPDLERFLDLARKDHPEILYLGLAAEGGMLASSGTAPPTSLAVVQEASRQLISQGGRPGASHFGTEELQFILQGVSDGSAPVAVLILGADELFAWRKVEDSLFDTLTVLLVSLIVAFEFVVLLLMRPLAGPLLTLAKLRAAGEGRGPPVCLRYRARDEIGQAVARFNASAERLARKSGQKLRELTPATALDIRLPLFLFIFADELQKPFLPLYANSLAPAQSWISTEVLISLPIAVFMLVIALATLWAGHLVDRLGPRRVLLAGALPAAVGYLLAAMATDIWLLLLARAFTGLGYAGIVMAAQGYVAAVSSPEERNRAIAVFVGCLMAGSICGTAIGGILAHEAGYQIVFLLSFALTMATAVAAWCLVASLPAQARKPQSFNFRSFWPLFRNRAFLILLFSAAIPSKLALNGIISFTLPIYLNHYGASAAEIGRVILIYPILILFLGPWLSGLADRWNSARFFTLAGGLLSGTAIILLGVSEGIGAAALSVVLLGLAHAASTSPQISMAIELCPREVEALGQARVLSLLRTLERIGSVGGPLLMGSLIAWQGLGSSLAYAGVAIATVACGLLFIGHRRQVEAISPSL